MVKIERVYVVAYYEKSEPEDKVWTLSTEPEKEGWETDSGYDGYGLTKEVAEFYAKCINYCIDNGIIFGSDSNWQELETAIEKMLEIHTIDQLQIMTSVVVAGLNRFVDTKFGPIEVVFNNLLPRNMMYVIAKPENPFGGRMKPSGN